MRQNACDENSISIPNRVFLIYTFSLRQFAASLLYLMTCWKKAIWRCGSIPATVQCPISIPILIILHDLLLSSLMDELRRCCWPFLIFTYLNLSENGQRQNAPLPDGNFDEDKHQLSFSWIEESMRLPIWRIFDIFSSFYCWTSFPFPSFSIIYCLSLMISNKIQTAFDFKNSLFHIHFGPAILYVVRSPLLRLQVNTHIMKISGKINHAFVDNSNFQDQ
jgi:hypothetical protein